MGLCYGGIIEWRISLRDFANAFFCSAHNAVAAKFVGDDSLGALVFSFLLGRKRHAGLLPQLDAFVCDV